jgi:hypothetical protein
MSVCLHVPQFVAPSIVLYYCSSTATFLLNPHHPFTRAQTTTKLTSELRDLEERLEASRRRAIERQQALNEFKTTTTSVADPLNATTTVITTTYASPKRAATQHRPSSSSSSSDAGSDSETERHSSSFRKTLNESTTKYTSTFNVCLACE